jgi:hypothetical protein
MFPENEAAGGRPAAGDGRYGGTMNNHSSDSTMKSPESQTFDPADWQARLEQLAGELPDTFLQRRVQAAITKTLKEHLRDETSGVDGWKIYSLADAFQERPPLQYVVNDLFSLPSLNICYGPPGAYKSMLLLDAGLCVSAGLPWLTPLQDGNTARATTKAPVLWLDFDNGLLRTHERVEAISRAKGLTPATNGFHYVSMPSPWLDAGDAGIMAELTGVVDRLGAKLVVVDNLGAVSGNADENSAQMVHVLAAFRQMAETTGSAVVIIHHQRKSNGFKSRSGESLRGHSSIEAALDLALLVQREERAQSVQVKSTKTRGVDVAPFGAVFAYDHKPGTTELYKAQFFGLPVEDLASDRAINAIILDIVAENPGILKGALTNEVRENLDEVGVNRVRERIDALVATGKLVVQTGERTAKHYRIPKHET